MSKIESIEANRKIKAGLQRKLYLFIGVTVVVISLLIIFALQPTVKTLFTIISEIEQKKSINQQLDSKINSLNQLEKQYYGSQEQQQEGLVEVFEDLALVFPAKGDFSYIMTLVESIASEYDFKVISISFSSVDSSSAPSKIIPLSVLQQWRILISLEGSKGQLLQLLQRFESLPNFPTVKQISYNNEVDDFGNMNFSIEMIVYKVDDSNFYNFDY